MTDITEILILHRKYIESNTLADQKPYFNAVDKFKEFIQSQREKIQELEKEANQHFKSRCYWKEEYDLKEIESEKLKERANKLGEGIKEIELLCHPSNRDHEDIWRIAYKLLTKG